MPKSSEINVLRVPITMPEEMVSYLTKLAVKSKVTGGKNLRKTEMVRAMVKACLMESDVDFTGVKDEEELKERIREACRRGK